MAPRITFISLWRVVFGLWSPQSFQANDPSYVWRNACIKNNNNEWPHLDPFCLTKTSFCRVSLISTNIDFLLWWNFHSLSFPRGPLLHRASVRLLHVHGYDSCDHTRSRQVSVSHRKRIKMTGTFSASSMKTFICPQWLRLCAASLEFKWISSSVHHRRTVA